MAIGSRTSTFAHVMERAGLGAAGALCGLFVGAHGVQHGVQELSSIELVFAMMVVGAVGFYLGIDLPSRNPLLKKSLAEDGHTVSNADPIENLSAIGTFIAPMAALLSVYSIIVVDVDAHRLWSIVTGLGWLSGVSMQIVAGMAARLRRRTSAQTNIS